MKKIALALMIMVFISGLAFGQEDEKKEKKEQSICPITKMSTDCFQCHIMRLKDGKPFFGLKEIKPESFRDTPSGTQIVDGKGYYLLTDITTGESNLIRDFFAYLNLHKINHAILDIHSPGGFLFAAWRIKGLMNEFEDNGGIVETRMRGFAASAGAILFVAGTKGYRIANAQSELMFHELYSFKFIDISTPSDKEDEARVLRHLQDTISSWLATRGKMSKEEIDSRCRKKEFWMTGEEAFKVGFVDKIVGNSE